MRQHVTVRPTPIDLRRAADRFVTRTDWLDSRHSFSHGSHYDPGNTFFGVLVAHNADLVRAGHGFAPHPHRDLEILTWVLEGELRHDDDTGAVGEVGPGAVARLSAGSGVRHSEYAAPGADTRLVQMWLLPDEGGRPPGYDRRDVTALLDTGRLVVVASGMPGHDDVLPIRQRHAALHAGRLPAAGEASVPSAPFVHLYVAQGSVRLGPARFDSPAAEDVLDTGDAARISGSDGLRITAGPHGAEVLLWEMHSGPEYAPDGGVDDRPAR